jgi:hypothetical protein
VLLLVGIHVLLFIFIFWHAVQRCRDGSHLCHSVRRFQGSRVSRTGSCRACFVLCRTSAEVSSRAQRDPDVHSVAANTIKENLSQKKLATNFRENGGSGGL